MEGFDGAPQAKFFLIGDSKTENGQNTWPRNLIPRLSVLSTENLQFTYTDVAVGGIGAGYFRTNIDAILAGTPATHHVSLCNLSVNDFGNFTQADWITAMNYILDAIHTKWPGITVYLMKPWKRGANAIADSFASWIDIIIASRAFCHAGPDERSWLKGSDDGATMTIEGIHYSLAGQTECVAQWLTVLGF